MQVELNRRFSSGWTFQGNYTWSKALGEEEGSGQEQSDDYRNLRNRRLDKRLLSFHRTHVFRNNATWELPFGPGRRIAGSSRGAVARLVERWQAGVVFSMFSGSPIGFSSGVASWNTFGDNTAMATGPIDKGTGKLQRTGSSVVYFEGLQLVPDPAIASLAPSLRGRSTLYAVADATGRILMVNPTAGQIGGLASNPFQGPGSFALNVNLIKRIRISESKNFEVRADAIGFTNSPSFNNPNTNINSLDLGRITGAGGNRIIEVGMRFSF